MPNRSDNLARPRARKGHEHDKPITKVSTGSVVVPDPNPDWGAMATMLWSSATDSGVSTFYGSTDWATLYLLCDTVQHWTEQGGRRSPELLRVVMQGLGSLLFTEGDRRRLRVELEQPDAEPEWQAELHLLVSDMSTATP
ncbi:hypothetical protein N803_01750 [Knoellia subterranea KCTC 19937]|uniref:Uncharacterized protein n=1 Tax=Knoellia subterranea KCTC 19937 TaxID=1385521 RepID=A0A0A0JU93_9MICO|nr:hypothetical protein N803_01750 [Knoellia subterranea KCTC 19937]